MAYDWTEKQIITYDYPAQSAVWKAKFEHAHQEATHWMRRAKAAEAQVTMYQARERQA